MFSNKISQLVTCTLFILLISKQLKIIFLSQQLNLHRTTRYSEKRKEMFVIPVADISPISFCPRSSVKVETNVFKYVLQLKKPGARTLRGKSSQQFINQCPVCLSVVKGVNNAQVNETICLHCRNEYFRVLTLLGSLLLNNHEYSKFKECRTF